jgi:putative transcriptional regulator
MQPSCTIPSYTIEKGNFMDKPAKPTIYNRIAILRAERGLSRHDLAQALGIDYQSMGYLERGDYPPDLELALRIGEYFALPIEAIFSRHPFQLSEDTHGRLM